MARSIETEVEINGTASQVWEVLTDFGRYPEWNPFILWITGTLQTGSQLKAVVQTPNFPKITIRPVLLKVEAEHELRFYLFHRSCLRGPRPISNRFSPLATGPGRSTCS